MCSHTTAQLAGCPNKPLAMTIKWVARWLEGILVRGSVPSGSVADTALEGASMSDAPLHAEFHSPRRLAMLRC